MNKIEFQFSKDFSRFPGGRKKGSGPRSGEEFREDILHPLLKSHEKVLLNLDGAVGYPVSFLDEAFAELARQLGTEFLKERLEVICNDDPLIVEIIWSKINEAGKE